MTLSTPRLRGASLVPSPIGTLPCGPFGLQLRCRLFQGHHFFIAGGYCRKHGLTVPDVFVVFDLFKQSL